MMSTRLRAFLAHEWEIACDIGVPGFLAALLAIAQVTVLHHVLSLTEQVAPMLLVVLLMGASARRWRRRGEARAVVKEHMSRMDRPRVRRAGR